MSTTMSPSPLMQRRSKVLIAPIVSLVWLLAVPPGMAYQRPGVAKQVDVARDGKQPQTCAIQAVGSSCKVVTNRGSMSEDGRFVAFESNAPDLVEGDNNMAQDIFLRDMKRGRTIRVSVGDSGDQALGPSLGALSSSPAISADGRYVAFMSVANNLVIGDTNEQGDIFVRDVKKGTTIRVSVDSDGNQAATIGLPLTASSDSPSISADGRKVVFLSRATNLVSNDANLSGSDVFLHDLTTRRTTVVSVAEGTNRQPVTSTTGEPHISRNGRYVAFSSAATDLVEGDTNRAPDAFVRDLVDPHTYRASVASDGAEGRVLELSADTLVASSGANAMDVDNQGSVSFSSRFNNLVPSDSGRIDQFLHSLKTGRTTRISVDSQGIPGDSGSYSSGSSNTMTTDGRFVSFTSTSSNFGAEPAQGNYEHVYVFDTKMGSIAQVDHASAMESAADGAEFHSGHASSISTNGRFVAVEAVTDLAPPGSSGSIGGDDGYHHLFLVDRGASVQGSIGTKGLGSTNRLPDLGYLTGTDGEDEINPAFAGLGGDLFDAALAVRPMLGDVYLRIGVTRFPRQGTSPLTYVMSFEADGQRYELATTPVLDSVNGISTFHLRRCESDRCVEIATTKGGYGTTGEELVTAIPMSELGMQDGGAIANAVAHTYLSSLPGAWQIDQLSLEG